jgi:hypothetical protein
MANAFLVKMGHLIFKLFWRSMDPPDSAPCIVVPFFGISIYLRIRPLMHVI